MTINKKDKDKLDRLARLNFVDLLVKEARKELEQLLKLEWDADDKKMITRIYNRIDLPSVIHILGDKLYESISKDIPTEKSKLVHNTIQQNLIKWRELISNLILRE